MENIISLSIKHLKSKSFQFPQGWVEACIEWLFQEHKNEISSMSNDKWCCLIEQQWLFSDLRDLETPNLFTISDNVMEFNGVMCCQVMGYRTVSQSYYGQVRDLTGTVNPNTSVKATCEGAITLTTAKSCTEVIVKNQETSLLLNLTDGINNFEGYEYREWNLKSNAIVIGCKCRLKGPFTIRRRIALLAKQNIEFLGGEVEDLTFCEVKFLRENLELNKNKRKNPTRINKSVVKIKAAKLENKESNRTIVNNSLDVKLHYLSEKYLEIKPKIEKFSPVIENFSNNKNNLQVPKTNVHSSADSGNINFIESFEGITQLSLSNWIKDSNALNSVPNDIPQLVDRFDDEAEELLSSIPLNELTNEADKEKSIKTETISFVKTDIKIENQSNSIEKPFDKSEPFVYLVDVFNELSQPDVEKILDKKFKIKGLIFTFASKLKIVEDIKKIYRWDLQIVLGDGTATVDCFLSDDFITKEIGFTANHFQEMKKSKSIENYKKSFIDFQAYIVKCNCGLFTLQICDGYDKLCVVDYQPIDEGTVKALQNRISQTNL